MVEVLTFEVGGRRFGLPAGVVCEVLRAPTLSQLPDTPLSVEGVFNLRGAITPVIDLRKVLSLPEQALEWRHQLILVERQPTAVAVRVDRAIDFVALDVAATENEQQSCRGLIQYLANTNDGLVPVIDPLRLLSDNQSVALENVLSRWTAAEVSP